MKDDVKVKVESITVSFSKNILPNGEIGRVQIRQFGSMVQLTVQQARSLAKVLFEKVGEGGQK